VNNQIVADNKSKSNPSKQTPVIKKILSNGLTVLVRPMHNLPKVSIQLWYNVGSKDEKDKERGIAHLIEHMVFKGTHGPKSLNLSESDINVATHMLSGSTNAFTSYDFTGYLFNLPSNHWKDVLPIMADCMRNCSFKEEMLNSEMKAVIQELKMYRDKYLRSLVDEMIGVIFSDHPYHHPIIGYKQDLWSVHSNDLHSFYSKHYHPNNATLVVVGDVDPQEVFAIAQKEFSAIPAQKDYKKEEFYYNQDIVAKTVVMHREVQQPLVVFAYVIPGMRAQKEGMLELLTYVIGRGKSSRLYKTLVDELQLATSLSASCEELFDHGLFFILCEPNRQEDIQAIELIIQREIESIIQKGITNKEFTRALKQAQVSRYDLLEDTEHQAFEIGKYFLATGDENYVFNYLNEPEEVMRKGMQKLVARYMRTPLMHKGIILPITTETDKELWHEFQEYSDQEDNRILSARIRTEPIEKPHYAKNIKPQEPQPFDFPKPQKYTLKNGIKVFIYHNENTPKIDLILDLKAKSFFDPEDKQGIGGLVSSLLVEGTKKYSAADFADIVESQGMAVHSSPGTINMSMLSEDLPLALDILKEMLTQALLDPKELEKVKAQTISQIKNFWDDPNYFAGQLVREQVYKGHPYSKNALGTLDSIKKINRDDVVTYYKQVVSPSGARIALVGDLRNQNVYELLDTVLGDWTGPEVPDMQWPDIAQTPVKTIDYPISRDQIVLRYAAKSVDRRHPDYDKLLIFDQIFGGGALGSMNSRLFHLREQSGLFYGINGSLIANAGEQPGMVSISTVVSQDRLAEAERVIKETIDTTASNITAPEFLEAKRAILTSLVSNFASNDTIANVFIFLDRYGFPIDFFDNRGNALAKVTIKDMQEAVNKVLASKRMLELRVGRVGQRIPIKKSGTTQIQK
jgi:zinc protease